MTASDTLLEIRDLTKHFTVTKGFPRPVTTTVRALDGISFAVARGEAFGLVGESGCGKSTAARTVLRLISTGCRPYTLRRYRRDPRPWIRAAAVARPHADRVPGSLFFAQPSTHDRPSLDGAAWRARACPRSCRARTGDRVAAGGWVAAVRLRPPPARIFRRTTSADRNRPCAVCRARAHRCRRAGFGTRCLRAGVGAAAAEGPSGAARPDIRLRQPRPRRGALVLLACCGDVPRSHRGGRPGLSCVQRTETSVYAHAAGCFTYPRPEHTSKAATHRRRNSIRSQSTAGMPFPLTLLPCIGRMPHNISRMAG